MFKQLGKALLAAAYVAIPVFGWILLARSFKQLKAGEISIIQNTSGSPEVIDEPGIYFEPFPSVSFGQTFSKTEPNINFGPIKRIFVAANQAAVKRNNRGEFEALKPGYNIISENETFEKQWLVNLNNDDYQLGAERHITIKAGEIGYAIDNATGKFVLYEAGHHKLTPNLIFGKRASLEDPIIDFPSYKRVRINEGYLGVKTDKDGKYQILEPGIHIIKTGENETFDPVKGIQSLSQEQFTLGNTFYVRVNNGELGESYKDGKFVLLEPGLHKLPTNHSFKQKKPINKDIVDLGALQIVTVKEGQVAFVNTSKGVATYGPGTYYIKQEDGNYFNSILTTSLQGLKLEPLKVICSDQIEMTAKSMIMYKITAPLKTVGLGIANILKTLMEYSDGILRDILSNFKSTDLSPSFNHEVDSNLRAKKLKEVHDGFVSRLNAQTKELGIEVTDLQVTEILPTDAKYLATLQAIGAQQAEFTSKLNIAESDAQIAKVKAAAQQSLDIAAKHEQTAALTKAETTAKTTAIETETEARRKVTLAKAEADSIDLITKANTHRILELNKAMKGATKNTEAIMLVEAQGKITAGIMAHVKNPVFVQPSIGDTNTLTRDGTGGFTMFSTRKQGQAPGGGISASDVLALQAMRSPQG